MILNWTKGNVNFYTKRYDIADRAIRKGNYVVSILDKSHIFRKAQF
jgi:hypothetical protein